MVRGSSDPEANSHCPVCKQATGGESLTALTTHMDKDHPQFCYCGVPLKKHRRCVGCGVYIGPGHEEIRYRTVEGQTLCLLCLRLYKLNPERLKRESVLCQAWGVTRLTMRSHDDVGDYNRLGGRRRVVGKGVLVVNENGN